MLSAEVESRLDKYSHGDVLPKRGVTHTRNVQIRGECKEVVFSMIQDDRKREEARDLLNDRYGWRGYGSAHELHSDMFRTTFVAEVDDQVVGTMTLVVDSDRGLAIDRTFSEVATQVRREPRTHLCELTKLAFDEGLRSKEVLAGLFHMAFIYGTTYTACTDLFIEVNPRHVRFYELMLGFDSVGAMRTNVSVGAPSQLMRLKVDAIRRNIQEMAGQASASRDRSLYPYFFSAEEERRVRRSLRPTRWSAAERMERLLEAVDEFLNADLGAVATSGRPNVAHMVSAA